MYVGLHGKQIKEKYFAREFIVCFVCQKFQKYQSNMSATPSSEIRIKTEHEIEQILGIKTESINAEEKSSSPEMNAPSTSNQITWANEKKTLVEKIVALRTENQHITLSLQKKKEDCESLATEKHNVEHTVIALTEEINTLKSQLTKIKSDFIAQKDCDRQTIANLTSENKTFHAQIQQFRAGIDLQTTADFSKSQESEEIFEVEALVRHKKKKDGMHYLVRWKNFTSDEDTWEKESNLMCPKILDNYKRKMKL